jgi:hypothetical protein
LAIAVDDLQKRFAHEAVVLAQLSDPRFDLGAVDFVAELVAYLADELAQVAEVKVVAVFFSSCSLRARIVTVGFLASSSRMECLIFSSNGGRIRIAVFYIV